MKIIAPYIQIIKYILIVVIIVFSVWFYKDWQYQKSENERQTENIAQLIKSDSLHYASQVLSDKELKDYLQYQDKDFKKKLADFGINEGRIKEIIHTNYYYNDTTKSETDVSGLVDAIKSSIPKEQKWTDSTKCSITRGKVSFDGNNLKVIVNEREFKNWSDAVAFWERRQWEFLGIKTRLFGKKQFSAKVFDECGESRVLKIEKKK